MKRSLLMTLGLLSTLFIFTYSKCFSDFVDSIVITLDNNNRLTDAYFTVKACPTAGDQSFIRIYSVKEMNDSLASISRKLRIQNVELKSVVNYTLDSFKLIIVQDTVSQNPLQLGNLKFNVLDYVSVTLSSNGITDSVVYKSFFNNVNKDTITIIVPQSDIKKYIQGALNAPGNTGFIKYRIGLFTNAPVPKPVRLHAIPYGKIEILTLPQ